MVVPPELSGAPAFNTDRRGASARQTVERLPLRWQRPYFS